MKKAPPNAEPDAELQGISATVQKSSRRLCDWIPTRIIHPPPDRADAFIRTSILLVRLRSRISDEDLLQRKAELRLLGIAADGELEAIEHATHLRSGEQVVAWDRALREQQSILGEFQAVKLEIQWRQARGGNTFGAGPTRNSADRLPDEIRKTPPFDPFESE